MIKRKLKPCATCGDPKFIFGQGNCMECYNMLRAVKARVMAEINKPVIKPKPVRIALVSKTRAEALIKYRRLRDNYFKEHPVCEYPGCNSTDITLHHKRGRTGAFLTDKRHFCSLCFTHHRFAEENPLEAVKMGLSGSRLDKHK